MPPRRAYSRWWPSCAAPEGKSAGADRLGGVAPGHNAAVGGPATQGGAKALVRLLVGGVTAATHPLGPRRPTPGDP
jgi:hypothetical protein